MSLRNQPTSERAFATFVILALAAFLVGGLAFSLQQDRTTKATPPLARTRLMAVLEGVMAPNVSSAETAAVQTWIQGGARLESFGPVEAIVANNCASCHGPGGQFPRITSYEDLRPLAAEEASSGIYALIEARTLHLLLFPLVVLVACVGYLRRTTWTGRWSLLGGCAAAVVFDAGQWWLRQGRPEALWAAWAAAAALSAAMVTLAAVVLRDLWGSAPD